MPRHDGGSPLTEYLLEMREKKGKNTEWTQVQILPAITTSFRVTKLHENTYYNFRLKAGNAIGHSEPKALEKAVKPQKQNGKRRTDSSKNAILSLFFFFRTTIHAG